MPVCSFTDLSFTQLSFTVCGGAIGSGGQDGLSRQFVANLQFQKSKGFSRVGLIFKITDITPTKKSSKVLLSFKISEKSQNKIPIHLHLFEKMLNFVKITFYVNTSSNMCILLFKIQEPLISKMRVNFFLSEARESLVKLLYKIIDKKTLTKIFSSFGNNPLATAIAEDENLTDLEALGITLIFEDDK